MRTEPEYKVGDRVRDRYDRNCHGTITEVVDKYEFYVKWDNDNLPISHLEPEEFRLLNPDGDKAQAVLIQAKIDAATASLEAVFVNLCEAHKMETGYECDEGFHGLLDNDLLDMSNFEAVVMNNGWRTSAIYC